MSVAAYPAMSACVRGCALWTADPVPRSDSLNPKLNLLGASKNLVHLAAMQGTFARKLNDLAEGILDVAS
jgi:hypothetical protein